MASIQICSNINQFSKSNISDLSQCQTQNQSNFINFLPLNSTLPYKLNSSASKFCSSVIKPISIQRRRLQIVNNHVENFLASPPSEIVVEPAIKIGIIGFGNFGQFLARAFQRQGHSILATSRSDYSDYCLNNGIEFFRDVDGLCEAQPDVVLVCSSIVSTENVVRGIPFHKLKPDTILADVLSVKQFPRNLFLEVLPEEFGILCTHPMFGPNSGGNSWEGLRFVYDKVRISESVNSIQDRICSQFLSIFQNEGCQMVEMLCEEHDRYAAGSQFITHTIGRILSHLDLDSTPINTKGYETLLELTENTVRDSFDLYYGLFMYNVNATEQIENIDRAFETVKQKLFGRLHDILRKQIVERAGSMENARDHQRPNSSSSSSSYFLPASTSSTEMMKDLSSFVISPSPQRNVVLDTSSTLQQQTKEVPVATHH